MDRQAYNTCMRPHMTGKGLSKAERQQSMCIGAKLCTGKAATEAEARRICAEPRPEKPPRSPRKKAKGAAPSGGLTAYLLTSNDCTPCNLLREKLKKSLAAGELTEVNASKDPEKAKQLINEYKARVPSVLVISSAGQLIASA